MASALALLLSLGTIAVLAAPARADVCDPVTGNVIACENAKDGAPASEWETTGVGDDSVEGFTTDISTNIGGTVSFKIHADANYTMDIYRMGYYDGDGARKVATVAPNQTVSRANKTSQCLNDSDTTGLIDCGTWGVSATWPIPTTAVSGIYFAHITRTDTGGDSHIPFVVRNDSSTSKMLFQASDTTWQAYNTWGGNSFYEGQPAGRAYKLSYNRPFNTRSTPGGRDFVFANEYPMIRFMEANGYDLSYQAGVDTDRYGSLLGNHKIFLSVGHDEYWSGQQRANVEAARDAGMHLAFFSANEVYWKTRYEPSVAAAGGQSYRTLVTYKETKDNARTDPTGTWTGTWRDPRFSPPADGGRPENSLTGTIFTVNSGTQAIKVPAADGKMRFWRGTAVGAQAAGATATLPMNTLGYEWDEDLDNGFRPAGAIRLSTANYDVPEKLIDYGSLVAPGNATHHLMLYRAPSGALVFGAGTVQWSWGLDAEHDGATTSTDPSMRQATVNLFADMGAQPSTLQSGLSAATASLDSAPATATITSPAAGAALSGGSTVTVSGTAGDAGGGRVGGVEVSVDNGQTWHPADGRESWSYSWNVNGLGSTSILARATDDSANRQVTPTQRQITVACPCSMFAGETPVTTSDTDTSNIELGLRFKPQSDGYVTGVKFYKGTGNTGTHTGALWSNTGTPLATGTFVGETASGWQTLQFATAVPVTAGTTYVASYHAPNGRYASTPSSFLQSAVTQPPLVAPKTTTDEPNGVFEGGPSSFPTRSLSGANYFVTPVFDTVEPPDVTPPAVVSTRPVTGAASVKVTATPSVTFTEPIKPGTLTLTLTGPVGLVGGTTTLDASRTTASFTPTAALAGATSYTLATSGGTDDSGNPLAAAGSTFRTATASIPGECPCSIWSDSDEPATVSIVDASPVELGVKFRADQAGFISGIRFYKGPQNIGAHIGTLWSSTGTQLATATFGAESASGWQEVRFGTRVAVTAGTTYVASYHTSGYYSATSGALADAVTNGPLTALATGESGANGVYRYGARSFPDIGTNGTSYAVDVVFELPPDVTAPAVASTSPSAAASNVRTGTVPTATFSERVVSGLTGTLMAGTGTGTGTGTVTVAATVALDPTGRRATVTPTAGLQPDTTYTVSLAGAKDAAGNTMTSAYTWSFSTNGTASCPCTLYPSDHVPATPATTDTSALELGVRITPAANGYITGVRFYKGAGNTGTHTGSLWTAAGGLITAATFAGESATGWQQVTFSALVPVTAGTSYVASYSDPAGHYASDSGQLNGAWVNGVLTAPADAAGARNGVYGTLGRFPTSGYQAGAYGVDVTFTTAAAGDTVAPSLASTNPVNGATSVPTTQAPVARFDEPLDQASVQATLTGPGTAVVPATVTAGADKTVTVTPVAALAGNTAYTVRITGSDLAGNPLASPAEWSYRTAKVSSSACPCSLWPDDATPAIASDDDNRSIEVGVKFSAASDGQVTGVRFYKGAGNTGTHVGTLWSSAGGELAQATFTGESAAGWQEVTFAQPVNVTAGTTYVASYHAPDGRYAATPSGFAAAGVARGPLTAPIGSVADPNGVYVFGDRAFPTSGSTTNYWVDAVFTPAAPTGTPTPTPTPPTTPAPTTPAPTTPAPTTPAPTTPAPTTPPATTPPATTPPPTTTTTAPAPTATLTRTTSGEFTAGTQSGTYVSDRAGGDVTLTPAVAQEFTGSAVPANWTSTSLATGSAVTVGGGVATVSGRLFRLSTLYSTSRRLDQVATLKPVSGQWIGATDDDFTGTTDRWVAFRTTPTGGLVAETRDGTAGVTTSALPSALLGAPHRFAIDWTPTTTVFTVDGTLVATQARGVSATMRIAARDATVDSNPVVLDSVWLTPYAATGTHTSAVIDAGAVADWRVFTPQSSTPAGTAISYQVRTGPSATAGGTGWSAWATVAVGADVPGTTRFLQYRATLTTSSSPNATPVLSSVQFGYTVP